MALDVCRWDGPRARAGGFMAEKRLDILCVGIMVVDILSRPADASIFTRDTTWADETLMATGGDAMNEAVVLSRLGMRVGLSGRLGGDGFGRFVLDAAETNGVDVSGVRVLPDERTTVSIVLIDEKGERHFLSSRGNLHHFSIEDIDLNLLSEASIVNIGSLVSMPAFDGAGAEKLLFEAHARGAVTSADVSGTHRSVREMAGELKNLDYSLPSYDEAVMIAGHEDADACADEFLKYVNRAVAIKLGAKGCLIKSRAERHLIPGFPVNAVDTTGAGDNFVAGFLTGLARGLSLRECGILANATGAIATTRMGATSAAVGIPGVAEFMRSSGLSLEGVPELAEKMAGWPPRL